MLLLISIGLFFLEFYCVTVVKSMKGRQRGFDSDMLNQLVEAIQRTDINYYVTYVLIYASLIYLGLFYQIMLLAIVVLQGISLGLVLFLLSRINRVE